MPFKTETGGASFLLLGGMLLGSTLYCLRDSLQNKPENDSSLTVFRLDLFPDIRAGKAVLELTFETSDNFECPTVRLLPLLVAPSLLPSFLPNSRYPAYYLSHRHSLGWQAGWLAGCLADCHV